MSARLLPIRPQFDTKDVCAKDRAHVLHPWEHFPPGPRKDNLVIVEGDGAFVFDSEGRRYLDGVGGLWCVNVGHGRETIANAMSKQAKRLAYYNQFVDTATEPAAELASRLAEIAPESLNRVFFSSGGSDANEAAVRTIHHYFNRLGMPQKKKLISRADAYHGTTYLTMTLTGKFDDHVGFDLVDNLVHYVSSPNAYRRPAGTSLEEFTDLLVCELEDAILRLGPENVAAFFAEPVLGAGGVIVPPAGYHERTLEVCRRHGVLYVSDEVVTGFGRLGHMFASKEMFGIEPDIITCAKGLTSGYAPLGATLVSDAIYDAIRVSDPRNPYFSHGFTYSGHPVCCAAALANLDILEAEDLCGRVRELGPYFEEQLATLKDLPIVGDVRGSRFMLCVENVADKQSKALLPEEVDIGKRISDHCEARGLLVRPLGHLNVLSPPLILSRDQIDSLVSILRESIEETQDDLVREGAWRG